MPRKSTKARRGPDRGLPVSLKGLADYLGLSPATVSLVINRSPVADGIPARTKERVLAAARRFNYRPNFMARSLRKQRSFTVGVMVPEVSEGYAAQVMSGIEDYLLREGYFYFVASHRHRPDLLEEYPEMFQERAVEGLIAVDTPLARPMSVPIVSISGHRELKGVTNIVLNHARAALLGLEHLYRLGHRRIAFVKGQAFSSDTDVRWRAIGAAAKRLGLAIDPRLVVQLEGDLPSPEVGYDVTMKLVASGQAFTAVFAFNDVSAIGAIRALREAGRRVPEEVSVVGFDDIQSAAFHNPSLTTVRQPLRKMGEIAAETLLRRINSPETRSQAQRQIVVEPELVVRESTARAPQA